MSHQAERFYRINTIIASITAAMRAGAIISKDKFIAECCLNFGAGRRYVLEYLKDLEAAERIIIKDNQIWTKEALEAEKILNGKEKIECQQQIIKEELIKSEES